MSSDQYNSNWFRGDKLHFIFLYYVQHLTLTFHFTLRSMVIKHRMIQGIIYNREGFNTTIFKLTLNEMFLSWAVGQNRTRSQRLCRILFLLPDSRFRSVSNFNLSLFVTRSYPIPFRSDSDCRLIFTRSYPIPFRFRFRLDHGVI